MRNDDNFKKSIDNLFKEKELFHKAQAKLSFEEKIEILIRLQNIAQTIHPSSDKSQMVWKISSKSSN
jgi:hypothetical protein